MPELTVPTTTTPAAPRSQGPVPDPARARSPGARSRGVAWLDGRFLVLLVLGTAVLRSPVFFNRPLNSDEMYYAVGAQKLLAGGWFYRDVVDHKPPGIYWIYAGLMYLRRNHDLAAVYSATIAVVCLGAVLLADIGEALFDAATGRAAGLLYAASSGIGPPGDFLAANAELFMNLPAIAALAVTLRWLPDATAAGAARYLGTAAAGLLTAAAAFIKPQAAAIAVPIALHFLTSHPGRRAARLVGGYLLAALTPAVALVLGYRAAHALSDLTWAMHYGATVYSHAITFKQKIGNGVRNSTLMGLVYVPLLLPAAAHLRTLRPFSRATGCPRRTAVLLAWGIAGFAAVCAGGRFYPHYFIQVLPPLSLLAAAGLSERRAG